MTTERIGKNKQRIKSKKTQIRTREKEFGFAVKTETVAKLEPVVKKIAHSGFPADSIVQDYVRYAYKLGGMDLVILMECENGTRDTHRRGDGGKSLGLCQIHKEHQPKYFNDDRITRDWKYQIEECAKLRKGGTPFYGPDRYIKGVGICKNVVKSRFLFD